MSAFDKIFMMSIIHDTTIERLEERLELSDVYNRYCVEENVILNELDRIALYFNMPLSFFFIENDELKSEVEKMVRLMAMRVNKRVGSWDEKAIDARGEYGIWYPPADDFIHTFKYVTSSDIKLLFIVEGIKVNDKFSLTYTLGYQREDDEVIEFPITANLEKLYRELLIYIDESQFFEKYCEE